MASLWKNKMRVPLRPSLSEAGFMCFCSSSFSWFDLRWHSKTLLSPLAFWMLIWSRFDHLFRGSKWSMIDTTTLKLKSPSRPVPLRRPLRRLRQQLLIRQHLAVNTGQPQARFRSCQAPATQVITAITATRRWPCRSRSACMESRTPA